MTDNIDNVPMDEENEFSMDMTDLFGSDGAPVNTDEPENSGSQEQDDAEDSEFQGFEKIFDRNTGDTPPVRDIDDFDSPDMLGDQATSEDTIGIVIGDKHIPPVDWVPAHPDDIGTSLIEYLDEHEKDLSDIESAMLADYVKEKYDIDYEDILLNRADSESNDIDGNENDDELSTDDINTDDISIGAEDDGISNTGDNVDELSPKEIDISELSGNDLFANAGETPVIDEDSLGADHDGAILDSDSLLIDNLDLVSPDRDFMSDNGEIVIMDTDDNGDGFKIQYIDITQIAVVKRIRKKNSNVEDLVQSIKSTGLLEPLVVTPATTNGWYVLIAGYRRLLACAKAGKKKVPCIINFKANTPEIPIIEALYNHSKSYTIKEIVEYIEYLEKEKGIMSASMIEYLLQLNSGDYTKLKDILNDNDDDIVSKLYDGIYTIEVAFKKLEQRRKKESAEEKENKKAAKVYEDEAESGADSIAGLGDEANESDALTDEEIQSLSFNASDFDSDSSDESSSLDEMVEDGKHMEGFEPNKQDYRDRERLDPTLRRAVLARDNNTCKCCLMSGQEYTEIFDVHHIVEVYLGGSDDIENLITLCTCCHKLVHLYARGELQIRPESELSEEERAKFKKIVKLGKVIRKGMQMKGMKREELKKVDKADTIGRTRPGTGQVAG